MKFINTLKYYLRGTTRRFVDDDALLLASGIAFNILLCLIPILLLFSSLVGAIVFPTEQAMKSLDDILIRTTPTAGESKLIQKFVHQLVSDSISFQQPTKWIGIIILLYASSSLFGSVRSALHRVHRLAPKHGFFVSQLRDVVLVLSLGVLFMLVYLFESVYTMLAYFGITFFEQSNLHALSNMPSLLQATIVVLLSTLLAFLAYRFIPSMASTTKSAMVSAITSTILWESSSKLFTYYLTRFNPYSHLQQAYAVLLVGLIWVYFSSLVFILGGIIGQLYLERHSIISVPSAL